MERLNGFGRVLQVIVHHDDPISTRVGQASHNSVVLTEILGELNEHHIALIAFCQFFAYLSAAILASVVPNASCHSSPFSHALIAISPAV